MPTKKSVFDEETLADPLWQSEQRAVWGEPTDPAPLTHEAEAELEEEAEDAPEDAAEI